MLNSLLQLLSDCCLSCE